ncbi:gas vesicle protein GvpD [Methanolobus halotolerans]|uniref:non-specific serine/threonine protein kinase n=1 Tax=Methanolobus halotolerans TaxID=2052935 RepID=A0A4E0Q0E7_9EURY|nr:gas vesicle protein GvpD [Methanolobus halotolerans]TGC09792.1 circadian clock protein KaiC [Methanolobus halotolerans]
MDTKSTGIPGLDEILGGGIPQPSTILIAGNPGTGRTTLGIQSLCYAAREGEKVLYVCPTTKSESSVREILSGYDFYEESLNIRTYNISSVERDPLTMLVDLGNAVASLNPDRVLIDPVTPIGFGFPEAERRRFMYSLNSAINDWNAIVYMTGTMTTVEMCRSVITDIADGVIYLSQKIERVHTDRRLRVVKFSGMSYLSGEHFFEISASGTHLYPRIQVPVPKPEWNSERTGFGIEELEKFMGGGLFRQSSTLLAGNTGTGKTLFGLQFIVDGARKGEPGIISSFEETPGEIRHYAANFGMDIKELEERDLVRILCVAPSEINACKHAAELQEHIEAIGARRIVLDDISGFDHAFGDCSEKRKHLSNLIRIFKDKDVTSLFISGNMAAGSDPLVSEIPISSFVDNLILMRNLEIESDIKKALYILKMHGSIHEKRLISYYIDSEGIHIGEFLKDR